VTARDLALMAATLANNGVNPVTGQRALRSEYVENVLSVMGSCGMYDYAGEWIYKIGMPAKSGVGGGILAVLPGQLGIGVFSPLLDGRGNSVRGIRVCDDISHNFHLHMFNTPNAHESVIRFHFTGEHVNSRRTRSREETEVLHQHGDGIKVYELQGELMFSSCEIIVRDVFENFAAVEMLLLDLKRVTGANEGSCRLLYELLMKCHDHAKPVIFANSEHLTLLGKYMTTKLDSTKKDLFRTFEDDDLGLEWCEDRMLERHMPDHRYVVDWRVSPEGYEMFQGLSPVELQVVKPFLQRRNFKKGDFVVHPGDEANELFLLARGTVSLIVEAITAGTTTRGSGIPKTTRRLATVTPGMTFGEMAMIDRHPAHIAKMADTDVEVDVFKLDDFNSLKQSHPTIMIALLHNLNVSFCRKLRKMDREMAVFE